MVDEGPAEAHGVLHVGEGRGLAVVLVVPPADRDRDAIARRNDDAGRPDLDFQLDYFAGFQGLLLVVRAEGSVRQPAPRIELSLRRAQPAPPDGRARIALAV